MLLLLVDIYVAVIIAGWYLAYNIMIFLYFLRAMANHNWYLTKFDNYPKERKAFLPFVC